MKLDGVGALALVVIGSFAIDRIVTGSLFLLSFSQTWTRRFPEPASLADGPTRVLAEKKAKLIYFAFAAFLGIVVIAGCGNVTILTAMGVQPKWAAEPGLGSWLFWLLDSLFTGLLLIGGADRIAQVIKMPGAPGVEKPEPKPIQITGKLIIEDPAGKSSGTVNTPQTWNT